MPGVISADVNCTTGKAICEIKPETDVTTLVGAIEQAGFSTRPIEPAQN